MTTLRLFPSCIGGNRGSIVLSSAKIISGSNTPGVQINIAAIGGHQLQPAAGLKCASHEVSQGLS